MTERVKEEGGSSEEDMVGREGSWERREKTFVLVPVGGGGKKENGVSCEWARVKANRDGWLGGEANRDGWLGREANRDGWLERNTGAGGSTVCGREGDTNPNIQMLNKAIATYLKARTIDRQMSVMTNIWVLWKVIDRRSKQGGGRNKVDCGLQLAS